MTIRIAAGSIAAPASTVALQAGQWAAGNILADAAGKPTTSFHYEDKGIMAMIGSGADVAEMGAHHHELHGHLAFAAWLGVHAWLMSGVHERIDSFVSWGWDFLGSSRSGAMLDDPEKARIDWGDDDDADSSPTAAPTWSDIGVDLGGCRKPIHVPRSRRTPRAVLRARSHRPWSLRPLRDAPQERCCTASPIAPTAMRMVTVKSSWSNEPLASLQLRKAIDTPMSAAAGMVLTEMNTPMSRASRRRAQADENADGIHSAQAKEGRRT